MARIDSRFLYAATARFDCVYAKSVESEPARVLASNANQPLLLESGTEIVVKPRAPRRIIPGIALLDLIRVYKIHIVLPVWGGRMIRPEKAKQTEC
jgi:hypothetical protein